MASGGSERQEYVKNSKERSKCNDQKLWYFDEMKRTAGKCPFKEMSLVSKCNGDK